MRYDRPLRARRVERGVAVDGLVRVRHDALLGAARERAQHLGDLATPDGLVPDVVREQRPVLGVALDGLVARVRPGRLALLRVELHCHGGGVGSVLGDQGAVSRLEGGGHLVEGQPVHLLFE